MAFDTSEINALYSNRLKFNNCSHNVYRIFRLIITLSIIRTTILLKAIIGQLLQVGLRLVKSYRNAVLSGCVLDLTLNRAQYYYCHLFNKNA